MKDLNFDSLILAIKPFLPTPILLNTSTQTHEIGALGIEHAALSKLEDIDW